MSPNCIFFVRLDIWSRKSLFFFLAEKNGESCHDSLSVYANSAVAVGRCVFADGSRGYFAAVRAWLFAKGYGIRQNMADLYVCMCMCGCERNLLTPDRIKCTRVCTCVCVCACVCKRERARARERD